MTSKNYQIPQAKLVKRKSLESSDQGTRYHLCETSKMQILYKEQDISLPCLHIDNDDYPSEVPSKSRKWKRRSSGQGTGDWHFNKKCPYSGCKATSKVNSAYTAVRPVPQGYYCWTEVENDKSSQSSGPTETSASLFSITRHEKDRDPFSEGDGQAAVTA